MMESPENPIETPSVSEQERLEELAAAYVYANPEKFLITPERLDATPHVAELDALLTQIESTHDLEKLHAIQRVSKSELALITEHRRAHNIGETLTIAELSENEEALLTIREPLLHALKPITAQLSFLAEKTDATPETLDTLKARYRALSRAVGIISAGAIDHTR